MMIQVAAAVVWLSCGAIDLGQRYTDGVTGFSLCPPAGARIVRRAEADRQSGPVRELVNFVLERQRWNLGIKLLVSQQARSTRSAAEQIISRLTDQAVGLHLLDRAERRVDGREAVTLTAVGTVGGLRWRLHVAVIEATDRKHLVVELNGPDSQAELLAETFAGVLDSFRVLIDAESEQALERALAAGRELLRELGQLDAAGLLVPRSYYRFVIDDQDAGYVEVREQPDARRHVAGVRISERGWLFDPQGGIKRLWTDLFVSNDLQSERWASRIDLLLPPGGGRARRYVFSSEQGLRQRNKLVVSRTRNPGDQVLTNKVLTVGPGYVSRALARLIPRLVELDRTQTYAFDCYDSQRQGLVRRVLEVVGQDVVRLAGQDVVAYKIEDRIGQAGEPTVMWVDRRGHALKVQTGSLTMLLAEKQQIERLYAERCAAAGEQFKQLVGRAGRP